MLAHKKSLSMLEEKKKETFFNVFFFSFSKNWDDAPKSQCHVLFFVLSPVSVCQNQNTEEKGERKKERNSGDVSAQIFRPCALEGLKSWMAATLFNALDLGTVENSNGKFVFLRFSSLENQCVHYSMLLSSIVLGFSFKGKGENFFFTFFDRPG